MGRLRAETSQFLSPSVMNRSDIGKAFLFICSRIRAGSLQSSKKVRTWGVVVAGPPKPGWSISRSTWSGETILFRTVERTPSIS